ncbi:alpha/beta fold hydrolase [Novosphingobium sp. 9U]|uniref:alpha/beta fold hydrolase n=1 Tax=Novosphingobium sp. 9U TaxID=2653158 RepID=UPI00135A5A3F
MRAAVDESGPADGPALVLLHGQGGDLHSWDELWTKLSSKHHVVRYDLRGYGNSTAVSGGVFSHADDLALLLDAMSLEACELAGVSMGGGIALNFALNYPERVRRLVLISPQILGWDWSEGWRTDWARLTDAVRAGEPCRGQAAVVGASAVRQHARVGRCREFASRDRQVCRAPVGGRSASARDARHRALARTEDPDAVAEWKAGR